jgi:ABC-2 type transport system ATP-binding protein
VETVVQVEGLVRHFGPVKAVDGISFAVDRGEVFGLLGPNGAGKTTTLETAEGLLGPTSGRTLVLGFDTHREPERVKEHIGVQLQASAYFDYLTLSEILGLFGRFYPRSIPARVLLERVSLMDKANTPVGKLSGGQKQRFTVAAALVNDPEVVFLDEPTTGLDPQARRNVWDLISEIHREGRTVILTTHYMEEAQFLCQRVAIIDMGRIVALDAPVSLVRRLPVPYRIKATFNGQVDQGELASLPDVREVTHQEDGAFSLGSADAARTLAGLQAWANSRGLSLEHLEVVPATLEDVFLELTGKGLRD